MLNFEINKEIVFSTSHISKECREALVDASKGIYRDAESELSVLEQFPIYKDEYSFRIYIFETPESTEYPELDKILKAAIENECVWLRFDRDGPIYESFDVFEW